jgi:hypothetical protein
VSSRVLSILHSTVPRESQRVDLILIRIATVVLFAVALLPVVWQTRIPISLGPIVLRSAFVMSLCIVVLLAHRLSGDSVGEAQSGFLELLFLSGVTPSRWLVVRIIQLAVGFLSVWLLRIPFLLFTITLGGVRHEQILTNELLLFTAFSVLSSLALALSPNRTSRQGLFGSLFAVGCGWEFLLVAPAIMRGMITRFYHWTPAEPVVQAIDRMQEISLASSMLRAMIATAPASACLPTFILYGALTLMLLAVYHRRLVRFSRGVWQAEPAARAAAEPGRTRSSRRCWDDALAWQAYCIHSSGARWVAGISVGLSIAAVLLIASAVYGYHEAGFVLSAIAAAVALLFSVAKPSDCLSCEIRDLTIGTLLLTPHEPDDFYAGWSRGARRLARPSLFFAGFMIVVSAGIDPQAPLIAASVAAALWLSGPFFMLSPLVPFSLEGIATALLLFTVAGLIACVSIVAAVMWHPVLLPAISIPLVWLYNRLLRRLLLTYWMRRKIETII